MSAAVHYWLSINSTLWSPHNIVLIYIPDDDEKASMP